MSIIKKWLPLAILIFIAIASIIYSKDLPQKNDEKVFLTSKGIAEYNSFLNTFNVKSFVVGKFKKDNENELLKIKTEFLDDCETGCDYYDYRSFPSEANTSFKFSGSDFLGALFIEEGQGKKIKRVLANAKSGSFIGVPYTNMKLDEYSRNIKKTLFPLLFVSVFLIMILITKSFKASIALFVPSLCAAGLSLTLIKVVYGNSNLITSIIPLLMFVLNLSLSLHIHYTACELKSMGEALRDKKQPIFLMVLTTFIGFFSLYFSNLNAISQFGLLTCLLILITSGFTILWKSFFYRAFDFNYKEVIFNQNLKSSFINFFNFKMIALISVVFIALGIGFFDRVKIITDATEYFPKDTNLKENMSEIAKTVAGVPIVDILIDGELSVDKLKRIAAVESSLVENFPEMQLLSSNQLIRPVLLQAFKSPELPASIDIYNGLLNKVPEGLVAGYKSTSSYRMTLLGADMNVDEYEDLLSSVTGILKKTSFDYRFNGLYHHLMLAQRNMMKTLSQSFLISLLIISLIAVIVFRNYKIFFIFMGVNIIPVMGSFFVFWIFGLSFNIATVMTYSISLGLVVDSSFHLIHALNKKDLSNDYFYNSVAFPILSGSLLLASCFFMFAFNDFLPIQEFGIALGIILIFGMIFDLKILPTIYLGKNSISEN